MRHRDRQLVYSAQGQKVHLVRFQISTRSDPVVDMSKRPRASACLLMDTAGIELAEPPSGSRMRSLTDNLVFIRIGRKPCIKRGK